MFSRIAGEEKMPETGFLSIMNADCKCPKCGCQANASTDGKDAPIKYMEKTMTYIGKRTWLHHLRLFYDSGFMITQRAGNIGREELVGDDLQRLAYTDVSDRPSTVSVDVKTQTPYTV